MKTHIARWYPLWCFLIAASGLTGYLFAASENNSAPWEALSQQASLATMVGYIVAGGMYLYRRESMFWVRGGLAAVLGLVAITFQLLMGGDLSQPFSLFEHAITPVLVFVDVLLIMPRSAPWWYPLSWLLLPFLYLSYYFLFDINIYDFLQTSHPNFYSTVGGFFLACIALGYVVWLISHLSARMYKVTR